MYAIKPTAEFKRDYKRAQRKGLDMGPLNAVITVLAAGETLPAAYRDRPLGGDMQGYRECQVQPNQLLIYYIDGEMLVLTLLRTGTRGEVYHREGVNTVKPSKSLKSLYRSPLKTAVTLLLLAAAAFLFLYNLGEYAVSDREYREARGKYEGVLTVEEVPVSRPSAYNDFFLITDPTNPGQTFDVVSYSGYHHESLKEDTIQALSNLPHISRVERRYMTAGVSPDYMRLDTDQKLFFYAGRCIVAATIEDIFLNESQEKQGLPIKNGAYSHYEEVAIGGFQCIQLEDVELLAGDSTWLQEGESTPVISQWFIRDELRDEYVMTGWVDYPDRRNAYSIDNHLCWSDLSNLEVGRRYVFVLRNERDNETSFSPERQGNYNTFVMADDTLIGWWPYFADITDLPENWLETEEFADLRELIQVTKDDLHTFDVVYGDDMASIRRVADGRMVCEAGRFITPADAGKPVCVVSKDFLEHNGLHIGDNITLNLGNYLCEQYAPLGAVASTRGRYSTAFQEQTFTIVGTWRDLNEGNHVDRELYWCWSNNAIFVPSAFLPNCVNAESYTPKPAEISFVVGNPEEIIPFEQETRSTLADLGKPYLWSDSGWSLIGEQLVATRDLARIKLMIFTGAAILTLIVTIWLFIGQRKKEYAIFRALGMPKGAASRCLFIPFLALGGISVIIGGVAAKRFSIRRLAASSVEVATPHASAGSSLYVLGGFFFLLVLAAFAWGAILLIRRKSILELLQAEGGRQKRLKQKLETVEKPNPETLHLHKNLGGSRSRNWGGRYLRRLLNRNVGRSCLSMVLAALLVFAFGVLTGLRSIYRELYQNVEVKPVISGGLDYERAVKIADSGYVRNPYYEFCSKDAVVEMNNTEIIFVNRLDRRVQLPIIWREGLDEETVMASNDRYCIITQGFADSLGLGLGDKVRVNETNWWLHVTNNGNDPLKEGETVMERRDARRPFMEIAGLIQTDVLDTTTYVSAKTWNRYTFLYSEFGFGLDIAEYTLLDYHKAAEFSDYAKQVISRSGNSVQLRIDTSYADRMYKIHRLIESLYPLAVAAALLLGGVLPGLIVLHSSKEISILRALGVRAKECVLLYTLAEVLCALAGLVLGIAMVLVALHPELSAVIVPFAVYVAAHLAACALGSGMFAWLCARKRVLEQLQAKE